MNRARSRRTSSWSPHLTLLLAALCGCGPAKPVVIDTRDMSRPVDLAGTVDLAYDAGPCGPCPMARPLCDAARGQCVVCVVNKDCSAGNVCMDGECVPGCAPGQGCGDAGTCDVDAGLCRSCLADRDCKDAQRPVCDAITGRCAACSPARDKCPEGQYCSLNGGDPKCLPGCKGDSDCGQLGGGGRCCRNVCVDITTSAGHCGGCGAACGGGEACCNGACKAVASDVANCGACGKACGGANVVPSCNGGVCGVLGCAMGFGDCDKDPQNGCETNVGGNVQSCGACGSVCSIPNAMPLCLAGKCVLGGCNPGFRDCDLDAKDGCEVDVNNDIANCGACGANCGNAPHAVTGCLKGVCGIGACDPGFADCDKSSNNGCEVEPAADLKNCGACGIVCVAPPNVVSTCTAGKCGVGGCLPGFADCNNNMADGCESRLASDAKNCGACGVLCMGQGQNAVAACAAGMCTLACNPGFGDCDGNAGNGCEKDLRSDAQNCGACNNVCPQGTPFCVGSMCTATTHNIQKLVWDYQGGGGGCGDFSVWYTQNLGAMTYDQCETLANKNGAQFVGSPTIYAYNAPYIATVRWAGEADVNNAYVTTNSWNSLSLVGKNGNQACVLGYANANTPGNGVFNSSLVSNNGKTYQVTDYGVISEKTCYSNALAAGARPLNPYLFPNAAKGTAHMIENHSCHGSTQWTGAPGYGSDGGANHNYRCLVGYVQ